MKTVKYTGRVIRVIIVLLAIGLVLNLLLPACNDSGTIQTSDEAATTQNAATTNDSIATEAESTGDEPGTEEFGMNMESIIHLVQEQLLNE